MALQIVVIIAHLLATVVCLAVAAYAIRDGLRLRRETKAMRSQLRNG